MIIEVENIYKYRKNGYLQVNNMDIYYCECCEDYWIILHEFNGNIRWKQVNVNSIQKCDKVRKRYCPHDSVEYGKKAGAMA